MATIGVIGCHKSVTFMLSRLVFLGLVLSPLGSFGALPAFLEKNCVECHDADAKKGGLDMTALKSDLTDPKSFETWVKIFDRTANGEMPPKKKASGDASKGEKIFKNLCAVCHSLSVSTYTVCSL